MCFPPPTQAMAQIKFVRKRSAARSYVEASHKVPRCGARDNVERLSRPVKTDPDGDHSQTPKSKLPVDQSLPSSSGDLSPNKTRSFLKKITPTSSKPAVESTCTVHAHRSLSLARNVYVVPDCDRRSVTMEGRSTAKTIADFESHCRDDRLLDVSHGIVGLLAERIHPDSAERKASVNRIESMYTSLDFPEDMMDLEKGIYIEFRRVFDIIRTQVGFNVHAPYYPHGLLAIPTCCITHVTLVHWRHLLLLVTVFFTLTLLNPAARYPVQSADQYLGCVPAVPVSICPLAHN